MTLDETGSSVLAAMLGAVARGPRPGPEARMTESPTADDDPVATIRLALKGVYRLRAAARLLGSEVRAPRDHVEVEWAEGWETSMRSTWGPIVPVLRRRFGGQIEALASRLAAWPTSGPTTIVGRTLGVDSADFVVNTVIGKYLLADLDRALERLAPRVTVSYHHGRFHLAERSKGRAS